MIRVAVVVGVVAMLTGGCSQEYNGAWGFGSPADDIAKQQQQAKAAAKAKEDAEAKASNGAKGTPEAPTAATAQADASRTTPAPGPQFESPTQPDSFMGADRSADAADAVVRPASDNPGSTGTSGSSDPAVRPLSLFGVTSGSTPGSGRTSQFDGPDNVRRVTFAAAGAPTSIRRSIPPASGSFTPRRSTARRRTSTSSASTARP